jgi:uncharacterized membrane protein (TIGR02234 family)
MSPEGRSFRLYIVFVLAGAGLVLWGSSLAWITWVQPDPISIEPLKGHASGTDLKPAMRAIGLVALAGVPAVIALRGPSRRWFAAVLGLGGGFFIALSAFDAMAYRRHPVLRDLVHDGGCLNGRQGICIDNRLGPELGPALVLIGALLMFLAGLLAARRAGNWQRLGSSYEAPGGVPEPPVTDKGVWDALDRGDDPTA